MIMLDHSSGSFGPQPGGPMVLPCVEDVHYDKASGREQGYLPHSSWKADKRAQGPMSPQECASSTLLLKVPQLSRNTISRSSSL